MGGDEGERRKRDDVRKKCLEEKSKEKVQLFFFLFQLTSKGRNRGGRHDKEMWRRVLSYYGERRWRLVAMCTCRTEFPTLFKIYRPI
jgi:hypothetical protein